MLTKQKLQPVRRTCLSKHSLITNQAAHHVQLLATFKSDLTALCRVPLESLNHFTGGSPDTSWPL